MSHVFRWATPALAIALLAPLPAEAQSDNALRRCGLLNAVRGRTSLEEVLRMTMGDD